MELIRGRVGYNQVNALVLLDSLVFFREDLKLVSERPAVAGQDQLLGEFGDQLCVPVPCLELMKQPPPPSWIFRRRALRSD